MKTGRTSASGFLLFYFLFSIPVLTLSEYEVHLRSENGDSALACARRENNSWREPFQAFPSEGKVAPQATDEVFGCLYSFRARSGSGFSGRGRARNIMS